MASSSRSLITRLALYSQLRYDSRLLSSSSALLEPQPASSESLSPMAETLHITDICVRRMKELQADEAGEKMLGLSIEAGGCSGFKYSFSLDDKIKDDDKFLNFARFWNLVKVLKTFGLERKFTNWIGIVFCWIFERDGVRLVVGNISFDFVKGATVDYVEELIRSAFQEVSLPFGHSNYTIRSFCSNIKIMGYTSTRLYYLKKVTAILLSVSVFSFLFSQSSPAPLLHWYDHFVSNLYDKLFSYTPQRNYIFLLFNGIIVLILGTSGLINKIRPTHSREQGARIPDHQMGLQEIPVRARKEVKEIVEGNEDHEGSNNETAEEGEERGGIDEEMVMSMDELNKKCEDFITRVKQEIQAA